MKQRIGKFVVAAAMVLAFSGVARAHDDDDDAKPCHLSTLHGLYVFTASGFNVVGGGRATEGHRGVNRLQRGRHRH